MKQRSTIKDVARVATVSQATVSLALSGSPVVAEATRQRVLAAAAKLNYVPNRLARSLKTQRTMAVALVIPLSPHTIFAHPYFMGVLENILEVLNRNDFTLILSTAATEHAEDTAYLKVLNSRQADGIILASAALADPNVLHLIDAGYPFVYLGRYLHSPSVPAIAIDDLGGARAVTEHLLSHGRRRIAHISGPLAHLNALDRLAGYRDALQRVGLPRDDRLVVAGDHSEHSGYTGMRSLLDSGMPVDAVFTANDEMAFGAMRALADAGVRVPDDVAVAGFDNIRRAEVAAAGLTTVHQPVADIGRRAAEHLMCQLRGDTPDPLQVLLPTHLVVRRTCGCPPAPDDHRAGPA